MDEVAVAIADPVRREILTMLRGARLPAGEVAERIAARFAISRPAVSRHLRVLRECGLVRDTLTGRRRLYALDPGPLETLTTWLATLTTIPPALPTGRVDMAATNVEVEVTVWDRHLDALETEVYRTRRERHTAAETDRREERTA